MADKQVNQLTEKNKVEGDDLHPVYDSSETGSEKMKKIQAQDLHMPKWSPSVSPSGSGYKPQPIAINGLAVNLVQYSIGWRAYVSVADFIPSLVHNENNPQPGGGGPPYTYGIQKSGDGSWIDNTDPRQAIYEFDCDDVGTVLMRIRVFDQAGNWSYVETYCIIQDNDVGCVA